MVNGFVYSVTNIANGRLTRKTSAQKAAAAPGSTRKTFLQPQRQPLNGDSGAINAGAAAWTQKGAATGWRECSGDPAGIFSVAGAWFYYCSMRLNILAFAAGILLLQWQPALPSIGPWLMLGGLLLLLAWHWPTRSVKALALLGCFLFGFGFACWRAEIRLADELPTAWEGRDIELVGVVAGLPQDFSHGTRFEFEVEKTLTTTAVVPPHIMLSWYQGHGDEDSAERLIVKPGERWKFTTRLKRPHGNANPKAFDYEVWLLERGIRASGYIRANPPQLLADMVWSPNYLLERLRFKIRERLLSVLPVETYPLTGILVALAIGDQKSVNGDLWTTFNRTSTTHLFSVSGSHITLVAALLAGLVGWVWRRVPVLALRLPAQRAALLAGCMMAFIYVFLAGFGVPAQRTLYMLLVAALAVSSGRILAPSRILCLALLVVLLIDPWAVLAAGFWLSFGAVGALLYVGSALIGEGHSWRDQVRAWGVTAKIRSSRSSNRGSAGHLS